MKRQFILIFILLSYLGFSQCEDSKKLELGGSYISKTNNYIPFEIKYKDTIYKKDIFYPFDIKIIEKYSNFIFKKADEYIVERGGIEFFQKLNFDHLEVNYKDSIKVVYENQELYELSKQNITYWMLYTYSNNNVKYAFGLEFDKKGKMISEDKFPKKIKNINFEHNLNYCAALSSVKDDKRFNDLEIDFIKLVYIKEKNSFFWLVQEKLNLEKYINRNELSFGTYKYKLNKFFLNVSSNKISKIIKEEKILKIECGAGIEH